MPLDTSEKERIRYHLGYLNMSSSSAASLNFGLPKMSQTLFLVELAMTNLLEESTDRVRRLLKIMDDIETKLVQSQSRLAAIDLNGLKLRDNEPDMLDHEYARWGQRLADLLGVPLYKWSNRYANVGGTFAGSIPVRK